MDVQKANAEDVRGELLRAGERMRLIVESIRDYAIFMLDETGHVATWNTGARLTKGYSASEIIGKHVETFYTPEDRQQGLPQRLLAEAETNGRIEAEGWRVRKDGTRFWANVVITALRDTRGGLIGFAKVTRDLTERRNAEEERLRLLRTEAASRIKDEFLSIASHELRTPLTALKLQLDSLRQQSDTMDPKLSKRIERAAQGADRLNVLVESLLDVSRIETGRFSLRLERSDLAECLSLLVNDLSPTASKAGCSLSFQASGDCTGDWDCVRLEQVATNLISNAIKYAAGEPIDVSLTREGPDVVLRVSDRGPGMPTDALPKLFARFERAAPTQHFGGLGLGLYISQQIASAHGGSVTAGNRADGGACFTVRLPVRAEGA